LTINHNDIEAMLSYNLKNRNMLNKSVKLIAVLVLVAPLLMSCASLPRATVDLSMLLDKQIFALEQSHIKLIIRFLNEAQKGLNKYGKTGRKHAYRWWTAKATSRR
jgi:hypothetical protein